MWDKIYRNEHKHSNVKGIILEMSMSRRVTNRSGLIWVGHWGEHTFRHIFTNKNEKKINANFALMHVMVAANWLISNEAVEY